MTVETKAETEARSDLRARAGEVDREPPAAAAVSAPVNVPVTTPDSRDINRHLLHLLERSAQSLGHAAESVENRGLKVLLKVLAQERVYMLNTLRQAIGRRAIDPLDPKEKSPVTSVEEGLQDLQASMTVKQQGRENVTLNYLLDDEDELLEAYAAALHDRPTSTTRQLLEAQQAHVAKFNRRLRAVDEGIEPIVARVFDRRIEGESAVQRLRDRGLEDSQIDMAPINQVAQPVLHATGSHRTAKNTPQNTMVAGALVGALCGGIFGLAFALFVWFAPQYVAWVSVPGWQLLVGSIIAGAVAGLVFGFFIGQNQREIDQSVTADSLINGEILVVAYPKPGQIDLAEEILQVHHARELNR